MQSTHDASLDLPCLFIFFESIRFNKTFVSTILTVRAHQCHYLFPQLLLICNYCHNGIAFYRLDLRSILLRRKKKDLFSFDISSLSAHFRSRKAKVIINFNKKI